MRLAFSCSCARKAPDGEPPSSNLWGGGYKQALQLIHGELNPREALFYAQRNTRQYAKRQLTWFRRETGLVWLKGFGETEEIREAARERMAGFQSGG